MKPVLCNSVSALGGIEILTIVSGLIRAHLILLIVAGAAGAEPSYSYSGKYAGDPRFRDLVVRTPQAWEKALSIAAERTGVRAELARDVRLRYRDGRRGEERKTETIGGRSVQVIYLSIESYLLGMADLETELAHELTHALQRLQMGDRYRRLAPWVKEGAAVWSASQIEEKALALIPQKYLDGDALALVNGLASEGHSTEDYLEDGLFYLWLEREIGADGIRAAFRSIENGRVDRAFERATGREWDEIKEQAYEFARSYVQDKLDRADPERFEEARGLFEDREFRAAERALRSYLEDHRDGILGVEATYLLGKTLLELRRPREAAHYFREVTTRYARTVYRVDDAQYRLGLALFQARDYEGSERALQKFLHDMPFGGPGLRANVVELLERVRRARSRG